MAKYENIKRNLESIKTNKVGDNLLSIKNIAEHFGYTIDEVRPVVQDLIQEKKMRFRNPMISERIKTYDIEYLEVIKQRKINRKDISRFY